MKVQVQNYTFNAAAKTVTFTDYAAIELERVLVISNVTDGILIFNFAVASMTGTVAANVLTLTFDTTSMSNLDDLAIFYDDPALEPDFDSGGGVKHVSLQGIALPASGGPVVGGTSANPVRVDPTGTTTQPVSGTVSVGSLPAGSNLIGLVQVRDGAAAETLEFANLDYDTGAGTVNQSIVGLALPGSGGPVAGGTSTNPVRVDPTGTTTQPVSGTVTETNSAAIAASLSVMDDWDETNRAAVNPIVGQVGVQGGAGASTALTQRVAIATDANVISGAVTANAGTNLNTSALALESGGNLAAATTALQIIDDWDNAASDGASVSGDVAHDAADAGEPVKIGAKAINHGTTPTAVSSNDRTNLYASRNGTLFVMGGDANVKRFSTNYTSAQTDVEIAAAATNKRIIVTSFAFTCDDSNTVDVNCVLEFGSTQIAQHPGLPRGGVYSEGSGSGILSIGGTNVALTLTVSVPTGGSVTVNVTYYEVTEA